MPIRCAVQLLLDMAAASRFSRRQVAVEVAEDADEVVEVVQKLRKSPSSADNRQQYPVGRADPRPVVIFCDWYILTEHFCPAGVVNDVSDGKSHWGLSHWRLQRFSLW